MMRHRMRKPLVKYNLDLLTYLNVAQIKDQFPAQATEESQEAKAALKQANLQEWGELALSQVNESNLD